MNKLGEMLKKKFGSSGESDSDDAGGPEEAEGGDEHATELAQSVLDAVKSDDAGSLASALAAFCRYVDDDSEMMGGEMGGEKKKPGGLAIVLGK